MQKRRLQRAIIVGVSLFVLVVLTAASGLAEAEQGGLLGPDYQLSPGDVLQVDIFGDAQMSGVYTIGPAGTITIPQLGQVHLRNMTFEEAREHLTERLGELLRLPHVVLSIREIESVREVHVSGYVQNPGALTLPFGAKVLDAVIGAGLTDLSDLQRVRVTHPGEEPKVLDLSGIRTEQPIEVTERVQYGDLIYVPKVRERISVLGFVKNPITVPLPVGQEIRVLEAITRLAGGLAAGADTSTATLIHENEKSESIDLHRLIDEGDISENKLLCPGDVVVVNEAESIAIVGEVTTPATFRTGKSVTAMQLLGQAQGFTPRADLAAARIYSPDGETRPVDLKALWEKGDLSQNVDLFPGDVLVIPEREPETILIVGAVAKSQVLSIADIKERDILRIVTLSNPTPAADLHRVTIYRGQEVVQVDVKAMMDEGQLSENIDVNAEDIVMIPEKETLYVLGAVGVQGKFPWEPDITVLDVIARSGGLSDGANTEEVHILRHAEEEKKWEHIEVSVGDYRQGVPPDEAILEVGDIVYVPPKKPSKPLLAQIRDLFWLSSIFNIFE